MNNGPLHIDYETSYANLVGVPITKELGNVYGMYAVRSLSDMSEAEIKNLISILEKFLTNKSLQD